MIDKIKEIIDYSSEGPSVDFKQQQYQLGKDFKKHEILKDISSMANHPSNEDKYIIVGVIESNGMADTFISIEDLIDEAKYQEYIYSNLEPEINFEYKGFEYKGYNLAYFRIFNNNNRPYLLKKDVVNAKEGGRVEFREGDGYIRKGTSTKKITRQDLDNIYENKLKVGDRKHEISIKYSIEKSKDEYLKQYNVYYIDINIENMSKSSIILDIEMTVCKHSDHLIIDKTELQNELIEKDNKEKRKNYIASPIFVPRIPAMDVRINDYKDHVIIKRNKSNFSDKLITMPQHSIENNVFSRNLAVITNFQSEIKAEVVIRSDSFVNGPLIKEVYFPFDKIVKNQF